MPSTSWAASSCRLRAAARWCICARLRPEYIREAFTRYKITYMAVVPLILKNLERGLRERFAALPPAKRRMLNALIGVNRAAHAAGGRGCG